uniref:receptor protein serine/threonine kinase n=1 Tax=Isodiametra pulchra TaxID=504439 RepID=A0A2P1DVA3_ISOPU|nr:type I Bmp receptor [Isodiametra pulchra]
MDTIWILLVISVMGLVYSQPAILQALTISPINTSRITRCYCIHHCPDNAANGTCSTHGDGRCFSQIELLSLSSRATRITKGCTPPETGSVFQCRSGSQHVLPKVIECCDSDLCNANLNPVLTESMKSRVVSGNNTASDFTMYAVAVVCSVTLVGVFLIILGTSIYIKWVRDRRTKTEQLFVTQLNEPPHALSDFELKRSLSDQSSSRHATNGMISTLQDIVTESSGSGRGAALLVQSTVGRQCRFIKEVGKGRFGSVWKATWFGDPIAVKIFSTIEENSWMREAEIYQTTLLRHDGILGFIAADIGGTGTSTNMILVMEYHEYGSLFDFLQERRLDAALMLRLMHTFVAGLCHLHTEIIGSQGKPPIAHRDLKTKNILVKGNLTCCIADLGHCARYLSERNEIDLGYQTGLVGTKRYMPPEVVTQTVVQTTFEALKAADMYNVALILWEIARCGVCCGESYTYQYPYQQELPVDPSVQHVYHVICVLGIRPTIPGRWQYDPTFKALARIMTECWSADWQCRQSALRVKKTLAFLTENCLSGKESEA